MAYTIDVSPTTTTITVRTEEDGKFQIQVYTNRILLLRHCLAYGQQKVSTLPNSISYSTAPAGPPTNFTTVIISSSSILLSWEPPEATLLNGILRHYIVSLESDVERVIRNVTSFQRSVVVSGLRPYTEYSCSVQAETVDVGPPTSSISRITLEDG